MDDFSRQGEFDELMDIEIVEVKDPGLFYGKTCDDGDEYEILDKVINDHYNNDQLMSLAPYSPRKNEICIAKSPSDGKWHRAQAQEMFSTLRGPKANCFFVDIGNTELVPIQCLKKAAKKYLELPFQVKTFCLYGIKALTLAIQPDGTTAETACKVWDTSAEEFMRRFLKENSATKYHLKNVDSEGVHYIILHVRTKKGEEITMNDLLVNKKYATKNLPNNGSETTEHNTDGNKPVALSRSHARAIEGYCTDSDKGLKRSSRLQKCVELQNRASLSDTEMTKDKTVSIQLNRLLNCSREKEVKGQQLPREKDYNVPISKSISESDTTLQPSSRQYNIHKSLSDTESNVMALQQKTLQNVISPNISVQSITVPQPRFGLSPRIPGVLSPYCVRSPNTSVSPTGLGLSPRIPAALSSSSVGSRMTMLQKLIGIDKQTNVSVSDTEAAAIKSAVTNWPGKQSNHTDNKLCLSDGDNVRGISSGGGNIKGIPHNSLQPSPGGDNFKVIPHNSLQPCQDKLLINQNIFTKQLSSDGNISDSSTATSDSRNLLNLRGLLPNADPNVPIKRQRLPKHALMNTQSQSDSSDTDNITPSILSSQKTKLPVQESDNTVSSPEMDNIRPILKKRSSIEKQTVRFSDSVLGTDVIDRKIEMFGKLRGKKLLETLNVGCKRSSDQDQAVAIRMKEHKEGVLVHSSESVEPFYKMEDVPFHHLIMEVIKVLDFPAPSPIQSYVWRGIFRGNNVIGIAPTKSGKTVAYLFAIISNLLSPGSYSDLKSGNGPLAIVLVPSWKKANILYDMAIELVRTLKKPRVQVIYGGNSEDSLVIPLINGCELLIATPPCLERMINQRATHLDRLCHLVIDDAEVLLEEYHEEVKGLMDGYRDVLKEQGQRSAPQQILLFGNHWSEPIHQFTWAYMADPVLVFTSLFEAAVYGKVKQVVTMCKSEQRSAQFVGMLDTVITEGSRVVIFTNTTLSAIRVKELLSKNSMYALVAHGEMDKYDVDQVREEWYQPLSNDSDTKILVCLDTCLADLQITNATTLIHYDLSDSKTRLGIRVGCLRDNYWHFDQSEKDKTVTPTSYIMMTEQCHKQARHIYELLKRIKCPIPPQLTAMLAGMTQEKEKDKTKDLCHFMKAYGECRNRSSCESRHLILPDNSSKSSANELPTSGEVKVLVTHVVDASHVYVRLLEHRSPGGDNKRDMSAAYLDLLNKMAVWFGDLQNRKRQTQLCPGELCALEDDDVFYRVRIYDISGTNTPGKELRPEVWYVDDGRKQNVATHRLYVLPSHLQSIPYQAVGVYVCRVKPVDRDDNWTDKADVFMYELLHQKILDGKIVLSLDNTLWLDPLVERQHLHAAQTIINKMHVRSELLKNKFAVDNPKHLQKLYEACKGRVEIPEVNKTKSVDEKSVDSEVLPESNVYHDVYLHEMELPDLLFLHKKETNKRLEVMMSKLTERVNKSDSGKSETFYKSLDVGTVCLAQCTRDDSWNRAKVLQVLGDGNVVVFYADYGDKDTVELDRIRSLPKEFMDLPFQAIECELAHVQPRGDTWTDDSGDALWDLSHGINGDKKLLVSKIVSKTASKYAGFHKYKVELFDTSTPDDINLSQEMVWSGVASPDENSSLKELFSRPAMFGNIHISPVMKIVDLCATIYWSEDDKRKLMAAKEIYQIVSKTVQRSPLDLVGYKGIAPIIKLIGRIINAEVHNYMLDCLLCAAAADDRLSEEILNQDGALCISKCLEQNSRPQVQEHAIRTIAKWIKANLKFRQAFEDDNIVIGLLCELLEASDTEVDNPKDEVLVATCNTLTTLCKGSKRSVDLVHGYKICTTIQKCLHNTKSHTVTEAIFMFLASLIEENRTHDSLKKEKLARAVVAKIDTNIHCEVCVMCGLKFCDNLCESGRKYKTMLLELGTVVILNSVLLQNFSRRTSELCRKIHSSIAIKVEHSDLITNRPTSVRNYITDIQGILPQVHWSQNSFVVLITVKVRGVSKKPEPVDVSNTAVSFRAMSENKLYAFHYELYDKVIPTKCHIRVRSSEVIMSLCKDGKGKWPRLLKDKVKPANLSVDFEKFVDSSSDSEVYDEDEPFKLKKVKRRQLPSNLSKPKKTTEDGEEETQYKQWEESDSNESSSEDDSDKDKFDILN